MSFKKNIQKQDTSSCFFGLPEFDAINNNGLKKGSIICIEEDSPTKIYIGFLRYFIGSGYQVKENSTIFHSSYFEFMDIVPKKLTIPKSANKETTENKIAWRYDHFKDASHGLNINANIPLLDLARSEKDKDELNKYVKEISIKSFQNLKSFYNEVCSQYQESLTDADDYSLKRIVIKDLFQSDFYTNSTWIEKMRFFHSLNYFAKASHLLLVITIPDNISNKERKACIDISNIYIKIVSTLDKEAFSSYDGILYMVKNLRPPTGLNINKPDADSWCIKCSKKTIMLVKLHLDPENEEEKSQEKSSLLCMPNKTKKNPFEF